MARIVLVDDDANLRHTLGYALRQEGFEVFAAEDGERGLEAFRQNRPDVVLLDAGVFERKLKALNLAELLAEGEADIKAGRVRSARAFLTRFKHGKKIPR